MGLYFYLLFNGSKKTKWMIGGIFLLIIGSFAAFVTGIFMKSFMVGATGFMLLIFGIVLLASISFERVEVKERQKKEEKQNKNQVQEEVQRQQETHQQEIQDMPNEKKTEAELPMKELSEEEQEQLRRRIEEEEKLAYLQSYDEKKLKKLLSKGGAKKGHELVMIDSWPKEKLRQCPAYLWRERDKLMFLVLLKEAKKISVSVDKIKKVYYEKGVDVNLDSDYQAYSGASLVGMIFAPVLPGYYDQVQNGSPRPCKNLYVVDPGIKLTNTSAKGLYSILGFDFPLEDEISRSRKFDAYFIKAYHYQLLLRDNAMTMEEYRELLRAYMEKMSHTSMEFQELVEVLKRMMEYKVITKELADYCLDQYRTLQYERQRKQK